MRASIRRKTSGCKPMGAVTRELTPGCRAAAASDLIGQLWATVQKGRNYLDNKLEAGEAQSEADAVMEEVFGTAWQLADPGRGAGPSR